MTPDPPVAYTLSLIDAALRTVGPHCLADEHVFVLDKELSAPFYHRFVLANPRPTQLMAWFEVVTSGMSFYLDRSAEIPEWSYNWIRDNPKAFQEEIRLLFSSHILVEHQGTRTVLRLFGSEGVQLRQYTFTQGLVLNLFRQRCFKLYPPLFS
ncbi:hypothetical protein SAMN00120144_4228 [Hymenobacter roseosalivarius DSM 11622]|uniref:Uncharacterized protein n=1 Tax=Hymenobacter roseosalivarius DSM 11622 TaxID=645990 RepID=A0A1W1UG75_9BACT|nr:hypothetical protein [Hymenobacter roseosalivarius]SMB79811.1 hypothetical protein SAMN00120144_4228 [Hymenobacter roseosalivarius DSM 11622]